ncbi:MAG: SIMPL domain-containing protein [Dehalococcoidia bacterium]|jgi:uncharacterized protein YggE
MKRYVTVITLLALAGLALLGTACGDKVTVAAAQQNETRGITVNGEGKVTGQPDTAVLTLGVSALAPTVADARDQAASAMQKIIDSMKGNGVADKDIQSTQFSIQPEYDYTNGQQKLTGFRVTNIVVAKVRDINSTGKVLDDAVAGGGDLTQVQSLDFTIDQPEALQDQARELAMNDAKAKAQRFADLAGVTLGDPISIQEGSATPPGPLTNGANFGSAAGQTATPIQPGELNVDLTVNVVYAIQ